MNTVHKNRHFAESFFSVILFGMFVLFLLLLLLFSGETYQASVRGLEENQNLRTAAAYITTKFHQHDNPKSTSVLEFQDMPALCFTDTIEGQQYYTYIYLQEQTLKELFTAADSSASADMGTPIAELLSFEVSETLDNFYEFTMADKNGAVSHFLLHSGNPVTDTKEAS